MDAAVLWLLLDYWLCVSLSCACVLHFLCCPTTLVACLPGTLWCSVQYSAWSRGHSSLLTAATHIYTGTAYGGPLKGQPLTKCFLNVFK